MDAPGAGPAAIGYARLPDAVGDVVVAAEPLRHGLANAATGGIWRVTGTAPRSCSTGRSPATARSARTSPT